jgi:hypothetical protein
MGKDLEENSLTIIWVILALALATGTEENHATAGWAQSRD